MNLDYLTNIRHHIHQHPEISGMEVSTASYLLVKFKKIKTSKIIENIGGSGFLIVFDSGIAGDSLLFRSELDGLPIQETSKVEYRSIYNGKGHQCGHDGHIAILVGLGKILSDNPIEKGRVSLLFQPAEETGEGAEAIIHDEKFKDLHFDEVFALHNLPGYNLNSIVVKENAFTAAVRSLVIKLEGKTAHAAEPENGINPSLAVAEIIQKVEALNHNYPKDPDFKLATLINVKIGSLAYGVSAGEAEIHFTCRCWGNQGLENLQSEILKLVNGVCENHRLKAKHHFLQSFYSNENDKESVNIVRKSAQINNLEIIENQFPFKWGEDFGYFTKKFKGCLFGLGSGINQPSLHHPDYDFPDEIIETGIRIFRGIIKERLKQ